jgi:hypothetical protein
VSTATYRPATTLSLSRFLTDSNLLGRDFAAPSWDAWKVTLKAAFGEHLTPDETTRFRELAARDPPQRRVRELWLAIGRRGGKDSIAAAVATYLAVYGDFQPFLRRGEKAVIACIAVDREQAGIVFGYIKATFEQIPLLKSLLRFAKGDTIALSNGVEIVVATNSFRGIRGRTVAVAIFDEIAFWRDEAYANPDVEIYNALSPSMITLRDAGAMVIGISTVYCKSGLLYDKVTKHLGQPDDDVLAILAPSVTYNPTLAELIPAAEIARSLLLDPERAAAEWNSIWRTDIADLFDRETVAAAVDANVLSRPPTPGFTYVIAVDPSGGRGDAFTAAVGHAEGNLVIIDAVYERRAPFDPNEAVADIAALAREYRVSEVCGDDYGADLTVSAFKRAGIAYRNIAVREDIRPLPDHRAPSQTKLNRSTIYLNALPLFTSGRVRLVDHPRLFNELIRLERRTNRSGRDSVDHPDGQHDDIANAVCACLVVIAGRPVPFTIPTAMLARAHQPAAVHRILSGLRPTNTDLPGMFGLTRAHVERAQGRCSNGLPELPDDQPQNFRSLTKRYSR